MSSSELDTVGYVLVIVAASSALLGVFGPFSDSRVYFGLALIAIIANSLRSTKVLTASVVRLTDASGKVQGLLGYAGGGIQIGVNTDHSSYGNTISYGRLMDDENAVAFTFGYSHSVSSSNPRGSFAPVMGIGGHSSTDMRMSYDIIFDYRNDEPVVATAEHIDIGYVHRPFSYK